MHSDRPPWSQHVAQLAAGAALVYLFYSIAEAIARPSPRPIPLDDCKPAPLRVPNEPIVVHPDWTELDDEPPVQRDTHGRY